MIISEFISELETYWRIYSYIDHEISLNFEVNYEWPSEFRISYHNGMIKIFKVSGNTSLYSDREQEIANNSTNFILDEYFTKGFLKVLPEFAKKIKKEHEKYSISKELVQFLDNVRDQRFT